MISEDLWKEFLPGEPPEGVTVEQFWAARDMVWGEEELQNSTDFLQKLKGMHESTKSSDTKYILEQMMVNEINTIKSIA